MPAPAMPPIRAWELLVGRPHHQVSKSHTMAPTSPARTTYTYAESCALTFTILETVSATLAGKMNMATKLKNAAHSTATRGESTRVDTTVAMELAASWKPFKTSNTSATAIVAYTTSQMPPVSI